MTGWQCGLLELIGSAFIVVAIWRALVWWRRPRNRYARRRYFEYPPGGFQGPRVIR